MKKRAISFISSASFQTESNLGTPFSSTKERRLRANIYANVLGELFEFIVQEYKRCKIRWMK